MFENEIEFQSCESFSDTPLRSCDGEISPYAILILAINERAKRFTFHSLLGAERNEECNPDIKNIALEINGNNYRLYYGDGICSEIKAKRITRSFSYELQAQYRLGGYSEPKAVNYTGNSYRSECYFFFNCQEPNFDVKTLFLTNRNLSDVQERIQLYQKREKDLKNCWLYYKMNDAGVDNITKQKCENSATEIYNVFVPRKDGTDTNAIREHCEIIWREILSKVSGVHQTINTWNKGWIDYEKECCYSYSIQTDAQYDKDGTYTGENIIATIVEHKNKNVFNDVWIKNVNNVDLEVKVLVYYKSYMGNSAGESRDTSPTGEDDWAKTEMEIYDYRGNLVKAPVAHNLEEIEPCMEFSTVIKAKEAKLVIPKNTVLGFAPSFDSEDSSDANHIKCLDCNIILLWRPIGSQ